MGAEFAGNWSMKRKIGLIVNPIAGMGGSVGLKGTDGETYDRALRLGAEAVSPARTKSLFSRIRSKEQIHLLAAPGPMGEEHVRDVEICSSVVGSVGRQTSAGRISWL
jgi:predicted polyphosphate/ATP-dependent NAD kinase